MKTTALALVLVMMAALVVFPASASAQVRGGVGVYGGGYHGGWYGRGYYGGWYGPGFYGGFYGPWWPIGDPTMPRRRTTLLTMTIRPRM